MAYSAANLRLVLPRGIDNSQAGAVYIYNSPTDSAATVQGAGYISDGVNQGMIVGDIVWIYDITNTIWKIAQVLSVGTSPAVNLSTTALTMVPAS